MGKDDIMRQALRMIGRKGGRASARAMTKKQRLERAKRAGRASAQARAARAKAKKGAKR